MRGAKLASCLLLIVTVGFTFLHHRMGIKAEREFVDFILIRERGIFTLLGSKPVSEFPLKCLSVNRELTDAEKKRVNAQRRHRSRYFHRHLSDLWTRWKKSHSLESGQFLLLEVEDSEQINLLLINKPLLRKTLSEHYEDFASCMSGEFDAEELIGDVQRLKELFHRSSKSHLLMGVIFGYGYNNAQKYRSQQFQDADSGCSIDIKDYIRTRVKRHVTLSDLVLPTFAHFTNPDPQVLQYEKERAEIQAKYRGKDLRKVFIDVFNGKEG
jgi:hypothetical protein